MVLSRHPKKYKHLVRTMLTNLVQHENIITTRAKAKHLKQHGRKLLRYAKRAEAGQTSPLNLLKGRIHTKKAYQKLLLNIIPRLKNSRGPWLSTSEVIKRRRGDGAPVVRVYLNGNEKTKQNREHKKELMKKGIVLNKKAFSAKTLVEEKDFYEKKMQEEPEQAEFFKQKIAKIELEQWLARKGRNEPSRYALLV